LAKVSECSVGQHLPTTKSGDIFRLCNRRNNHWCALAEGVEGRVVGDKSGGNMGGTAFRTIEKGFSVGQLHFLLSIPSFTQLSPLVPSLFATIDFVDYYLGALLPSPESVRICVSSISLPHSHKTWSPTFSSYCGSQPISYPTSILSPPIVHLIDSHLPQSIHSPHPTSPLPSA
jgi:hypothetical protein